MLIYIFWFIYSGVKCFSFPLFVVFFFLKKHIRKSKKECSTTFSSLYLFCLPSICWTPTNTTSSNACHIVVSWQESHLLSCGMNIQQSTLTTFNNYYHSINTTVNKITENSERHYEEYAVSAIHLALVTM